MDEVEFQFTQEQIVTIKLRMLVAHETLAQSDRPPSERTLTARNYDSSISALGEYLEQNDHPLPTKIVLEQWRDDMLSDKLGQAYKVSTVNARLAGVRKMIRLVAHDMADMVMRLVVQNWATVNDAKPTSIQPQELEQSPFISETILARWLNAIDTGHIKGVRDRAIIAILGGTGLHVSEVEQLTIRDVFLSKDEYEQRAIHVNSGDRKNERFVLLDSWNSWVIDACKQYLDTLDLNTLDHAFQLMFRGIQRVPNGYHSLDAPLSKRGIQRAVQGYEVIVDGQVIIPKPRDLRRSYAIICLQHGMSINAVSTNLGHTSIAMTARLIGSAMPESSRSPNWAIKLK